MQAPLKWSGENKVASSAFFNCIDGDTTHAETANLGYTVKMRYLSINTPESTSEIEEWGLTASYFNKFIFTGDEHCLDTFPAADKAELMLRPHGATSIILVSSAVAKHETVVDYEFPEDDDDDDLVPFKSNRVTRDYDPTESVNRPVEVEDLMIGVESDEQGPFHAGVDGYGRSLCYVWYATVKNPTKNDFRCLNLEMVYQGLSLGIGSVDATSPETYRMFAAADDSAKANFRHIYSGSKDTNYFYYETSTIQKLSLKTLYKSGLNPNGTDADPMIKYNPEISTYADKKTLYRVEGYVTQKVGAAFYIQDNYEYDNDKVISGEVTPYGLYIFTLRKPPIRIGDYVSVIGAISYYSGTFQMQGISYHQDADMQRDMLIGYSVKANGEKVRMPRQTVKPIQLTGAQFHQLKLPSVLVEIVEDVHFYNFTSLYQGNP